MDLIPQSSIFLGIIPALFFLFITLKGYENYYKDKNLFLCIVTGMILGFIAAFVQSITVALALIYVVLLAFFDQLFKTIILNIGRLQQKRETAIYGLTLGLFFGSSFTPIMIIALTSLNVSNFYILATAGVGSFGIILFHGATGCYIGYGIFQGKLLKHLIIAILLEFPLNFLVGSMIFLTKVETFNYQIAVAIGIIFYGLILYWYVTKKILPGILKENQKRSKK